MMILTQDGYVLDGNKEIPFDTFVEIIKDGDNGICYNEKYDFYMCCIDNKWKNLKLGYNYTADYLNGQELRRGIILKDLVKYSREKVYHEIERNEANATGALINNFGSILQKEVLEEDYENKS